MSDLVERLRDKYEEDVGGVRSEAADEIERLEAEVQMLAQNSHSRCPESFGYVFDESGNYVTYWTKDNPASFRQPWSREMET